MLSLCLFLLSSYGMLFFDQANRTCMITTDIVTNTLFDKEILPDTAYFRPAVLWLFDDSLQLFNVRTGTYQTVIVSNQTSNSLLPAPQDCDNDVGSLYFEKYAEFCHNNDNIRVYSFGEVTSDFILSKFREYLSTNYGSLTLDPAAVKYNNSSNNYASVLFFLSFHEANVFACHVNQFLISPETVMNYVLEEAAKSGCNVFIDTGISNSFSTFNRVFSTCKAFGLVDNGWLSPMFIVLNTPAMHYYGVNSQRFIGQFNIIVFHGHLQIYTRTVAGYIPISTLYGTVLSKIAKTDYYRTIVDEPLAPAKGVTMAYRKAQVNSIYDVSKANIPYVKDGYLFLHMPRTTETRDEFKILKNENNARLTVDIAIDLIDRFKPLVGLRNTDEDKIKQTINNMLKMSENKFLQIDRSGFFKKLNLESFEIQENRLKININLQLYTVIMSINLVLAASS